MLMKARMSDETKNNIVTLLSTTLLIAALTVYCYFIGYSLLLPVFLFFMALHLKLAQQGNLKLILNLGLLLSLVLFGTHIISQYTAWSSYYIPVAAIAMLTMLLFNNLHLSFLIGLASSILVSVVLHGDFGMMLTFFFGSFIK